MSGFDVERCRERFPALRRRVGDRPAIFFDGPAGSQTPVEVADAVRGYLLDSNANSGGLFATSLESDRLLSEAREAVAAFLGSDEPDLVVFGPSMTTLAFRLARALARTWTPGDEIVVTQLEHDANYTPWVLAAREAGAVVRVAAIHRDPCTLDLEDLRSKLGPRTRLVAVTAASNLCGSRTPLHEIVKEAHAAGALVFVDAVHHAPHFPIDVQGWGADFVACSAYKFYGPHLGILWGRRDALESLPVPKLRPVADELPDRWHTGTQNHEGIVGTAAAVRYLAQVGSAGSGTLRERLLVSFAAIERHEAALTTRLLQSLRALPGVRVIGFGPEGSSAARAPTVSFVGRRPPEELARALAEHGIFVWHGHMYALPLTEALGLGTEGVLRVGLLHYNTAAEVDALTERLSEMV